VSQVSEELDMVFSLLDTVDIGISYNDGTGIRGRTIQLLFTASIPEVDGGGINPLDVAKAAILPQLEQDFAEEELSIRSAVVYRDISIDYANDQYRYWLEVTV